jgi:hypothetical protein
MSHPVTDRENAGQNGTQKPPYALKRGERREEGPISRYSSQNCLGAFYEVWTGFVIETFQVE